MKNEEKKLTFWEKLKFSIVDFDKYQELATEKIWKTIIYIAILVLIFTAVVAGIYTYKFTITIANVRQYIDENIETITFKDNNLNIIPKNHEDITKIENKSTGIKVIINTSTKSEKKIKASIDEINSEDVGILILKEKLLIKNEIMNKPYPLSYKTIAEQYNINNIDKAEALKLLSYDTIKPLIFWIFILLLTYLFIIIYLPSTLIDIIILSILGYATSLVIRVKLRYFAIYNIAAYSLTLPIILNIMYFTINSLTGFEINYFEVMYTTVSTIYIVTAILMIRSDIIKRQIELTRIINEQDKIREEMEKREEEKEQEEREKTKKDDQEKRKENKKKKEKGSIEKEPEGNNV